MSGYRPHRCAPPVCAKALTQLPITPPSVRVSTIVAERGRALLFVDVLAGLPVPVSLYGQLLRGADKDASGVSSPGCWMLMNKALPS